MSRRFTSLGPNMGTVAFELVTIRWGGGAEPGCYHCFIIPSIEGLRQSRQFVVDDFGSLVEVQS